MVSRPYFAHSTGVDASAWQSLAKHLIAVGQLAAMRAQKFGAGEAAALAGVLHDLGKYTEGFQNRLRGGASVDHSTAGAREVLNDHSGGAPAVMMRQLVAHCIAGHHAGLPDSIGDLDQRLSRKFEPLSPSWREELALADAPPTAPNFEWRKEISGKLFQFGFLGRMIFSCLVDADFRDTEAFYAEAENRPVDRTWPLLPEIIDDLIARFDRYMADKRAGAPNTRVNDLRAQVLAHVRERADAKTGAFSLNVPTGGGKTLASLAFALDHARRHGLDRIIYAIPYTSVIDQTASIFREVLGDEVILEHHSSIDEEKNNALERKDKLRLAMEDWAAPIIVTTNVQLFESLHANRPSRCRRLHNLARSVIILDEAQTIPRNVLRPCVAALDELTRNYGVSVVICTATQPAITVPNFAGGLTLGPERELAPDPHELHRRLKRVRIVHAGPMSDSDLLAQLAEHPQGLVIVNSRAHALALYRGAKAAGMEGVIHLTTRQIATHRREILGRVRQALEDKKPCRLIATSLVEAGVDLDFPRVWRAEAGLDQIAQAAGRCNREGKRAVDESVVTVFQPPDNPAPRELQALADDMKRVMVRHADLLSPEALEDYFGEVYWRIGAKKLDKFDVLNSFRASAGKFDFDYRKIGERFCLIENGMVPVIVARDNRARKALEGLEAGLLPPGAAARKLQSSIVQIPPRARERLIACGHVKFVAPKGLGDQFATLFTTSLYRDDFGLLWEDVEYLRWEGLLI
jgi:CRISPR-associated endonuclease/helicase Cas3